MNNVQGLGRLLLSGTHDLRNVLAVIRESSGLVQDMLSFSDLSANKEQKEEIINSLKPVQEQVNRGILLVDGIDHIGSQLKGIDNGQAFDLNILVQDFCILMARKAKAYSWEIIPCPTKKEEKVNASYVNLMQDILEIFDICMDTGSKIGLKGKLSLSPTNVAKKISLGLAISLNDDDILNTLIEKLSQHRLVEEVQKSWFQRVLPWASKDEKYFIMNIE